jgi:hypothetical protein
MVRQALMKIIEPCCDDPEVVKQIVDELIDGGWRPPMTTITEASQLDGIPDGSAVLIGNVTDMDAHLLVGVKATHCVLLTGEDEPYPFHADGLAPPLPCTVVWLPGEGQPDRLDIIPDNEADGNVAALLMQQAAAEAPGDYH